MKPNILLTSIFLVVTGSAFAQEQAPKPIRETLFGATYKEDMQKRSSSNVGARKAADARSTATSSKNLIFSDYHPQTQSTKRMAATAKAAGTPLPSATSAKDAAAKAPKRVLLKAPVMQQEPDAATSAPATVKPAPTSAPAPAAVKSAALKPAVKKN
jgi:hypothetical protein